MNRNTIRLDVIAGVSEEAMRQRIVDAVADFPKVLIYREIAEKSKKVHYQGIIYTDMKYETYKKFMEKKFEEWKGTRKVKGMRSFAPMRDDNYEIYITKDKNKFYSKGYTDEEISELEAKSYPKGGDDDVTTEEKKISRREKYYDSFIQFCLEQNDVEMGKYNMRWIGLKFYEFLGKQPLPELTSWAKSIIFSAQTHLVRYNRDCKKSMKTAEEWVDRILF